MSPLFMVAFAPLLLSARAGSVGLLQKQAEAVTPVQKVVELLTRLRAQVEEDGQQEAKSYDKFSCFCKEQADEKTYVIGKSNERMDVLQAAITELEGDITELDSASASLKTEVSTERNASKAATEVRDGEHAEHVTARKNLTDGIAALEGAMTTLRASKEKFEGAALLNTAREALKRASVAPATVALLAEASRTAKPGEPADMEFKSKDVLSLLQDVLRTFKAQLAKLDEEEGQAQHAHNMVEGARANKVKFAEEDIAEKETLSAKKSEEKSEKQKLLDEETADRDADQAFLDDLTAKCEAKATAWETRSKTRVDEVAAITEAMQALSNVGSLYAANKKLVGLLSSSRRQGRVSPAATHLESASASQGSAVSRAPPRATSFLQVRRHRADNEMSTIESLLARVRRASADSHKQGAEAATQLLNQVRGVLAASPEASTDHFVKVRELIKDLVARLEQEAIDEADAKSACDTQVGDAVKTRDEQVAAEETAATELSAAAAAIVKLKSELSELDQEIADLQKALNEMTQLRITERQENARTKADAEEGATAVRNAISTLEAFYGKETVLLQAPNISNADRSGNTVGDLAPETFEGEYKGRQSESNGVLGLLDVIASDFERTATTTDEAETEAEAEFTKQEGLMNADIDAKKTSKETKEGELTGENEHQTEVEDDLRNAKKMKEQAEKTLEALKASCVDSSETWAERKAKREQEIEALKQALQLLENWQN